MNFLFYAGKRVLQVIPALFGISIVVFVLVHLIPGDPADVILGQTATPARSAVIHHLLGIDRPILVQYFTFLGHLFQGSLGTSFFNHVSVTQLILGRLPATAFLMVGGILLSLLISVPLAILAASREGAARDQAVRVIPIIGLGMPQVWVGIELILLLGLKVRLFPVSGFGYNFFEHVRSSFLPALTIAISLSPILIRSLRASMLEILEADFVLTAKAKGIGKARVTLSHVVRNAIIASVTVLGVNIAYLVGSTVVVERVFAVPATGSLMIDAISNRDYPIVQGVTIFFALVVVTVNLLADLIHAALDPRVAL